jgi:hypothetical protein
VVLEGSGLILERFVYPLEIHVWEWDKPRRSARGELGRSQWVSLLVLLKAARFWELPKQGGTAMVDGSVMVLEGYRSGRSRSVARWGPESERDGDWFALPYGYLFDMAEPLLDRTENASD